MGVKVSVAGGGSTYTPELVEGLVTRADRLPVDELVLLDPDAERLEIVGALADRMLQRVGWTGRLVLTDRRDEALEGADFVIVQLRIGGQAARLYRRDDPRQVRMHRPGDHGSGRLREGPTNRSGGPRAGRGDGARRGAPGAWFVDFTNPTGLVTQALLDEGHRAVGLCNVAISLQRRLADAIRRRARPRHHGPRRVESPHVGAGRHRGRRGPDGRDREDPGSYPGADEFPPELVRALGAIPSPYLRYYYFPVRGPGAPAHASEQGRGGDGDRGGLLELYRDPALDRKPTLLEQRGGASTPKPRPPWWRRCTRAPATCRS